jgi:predicted ATP-grasp superfamily ATP-dependent carboligase
VRVLVAGVSTRAIADSAARAGWSVVALDAFADLDQHPSVDARSVGEPFSPDRAARAAQEIACDVVAYGANFENDPAAIAVLARGRTLWGNPPDVIRRVRDPRLLSKALRSRGLAAPEVCNEPGTNEPGTNEPRTNEPRTNEPRTNEPRTNEPRTNEPRTKNPERRTPNAEPRSWLLKPYASGGGHGVREWHESMRLPSGAYLQEFVDGAPGSIVFVSASGRAIPIGLTRQLVGDESFGVSGYRYCGNILTAAGEDDHLLDAARAVADVVCGEFELVGVNGIDLIVANNTPYAIEVNPRWCASMELVERAYGLSVFGVHASACRDGVLPDFDLAKARGSAHAMGKAVVFARAAATIGDTAAWPAKGEPHMHEIRDVPRPGTRIRAGHPICTVFATGRDSHECRDALVSKAERVYAAVAAML